MISVSRISDICLNKMYLTVNVECTVIIFKGHLCNTNARLFVFVLLFLKKSNTAANNNIFTGKKAEIGRIILFAQVFGRL